MRKRLRCHINCMITAIDQQQARIHYNEEASCYNTLPALVSTQFSDKRHEERALFVLEMELAEWVYCIPRIFCQEEHREQQ